MQPDTRSIVVIAGGITRDSLGDFLAASDVWLADNPANRAVVGEVMSNGTCERADGWLTTFEISHAAGAKEIAQVFDLVCDHYNEYAARGDWSSIRIITDKHQRTICETLSSREGIIAGLVPDGVLVAQT